MTRKSITTSHAAVACDVCGRTLLRGEHADVFLAGGSRRTVCELCTARAAHEGWIREGMETAVPRRASDRRGRSLLGRLRQRRSDHDPVLRPGGAEALLDDALGGLERHGDDERPVRSRPERHLQPRPERHVHAVPTNSDLKKARAVELFNGSEHPRKVAGISRSLGAPLVAVVPSVTEGSVVAVTVGWELSWYRYEVDLADEAAGVRVVDRGTELDELGPEAREPNATADETGHLHLADG